ncbi:MULTISPECIES: sarcosine oxidase subunit gamma [unclassified Roseitalea]|uniref:sarcosine oxidase subunit gamma n=1 Tax=unclassified Roseitalea TaxID=2639107 RepID=UPI00273CF947|nr:MULTISPECIES: sarcosine oxidase subunit gamma [unclassified Roseitalea]
MADTAATLAREQPLAGRVHAGTGVEIAPAPPAFRISLRAPGDSVAALSAALALDLPQEPKTSAASGKRAALWLGPDEWLVIDEKADPGAALAGVDAPHSAVDISQRNTAIMVRGLRAADVISHGCPQDLSLEAFSKGACSRTVFGKVEIVLHRPQAETFRIEVWRSFSDYVFDYLIDAARDVD